MPADAQPHGRMRGLGRVIVAVIAGASWLAMSYGLASISLLNNMDAESLPAGLTAFFVAALTFPIVGSVGLFGLLQIQGSRWHTIGKRITIVACYGWVAGLLGTWIIGGIFDR